MLYKQLQRINEIDQQIHDMHLRLAEYYRERASLLGESTPPRLFPVVATDPQHLYDQLVADWKTYNLQLPTYNSFKKRLQSATEAIDGLVSDNPQLAGNLHLIAVPPQSKLDKLLSDRALSNHYLFTEDFKVAAPKRSAAWKLLLITSPDFSLPVDRLSGNLGADEFHYKQYDCRGLGVRDVIAANLLGYEVATDSNWTLLLDDATSTSHIPCVTKQGDQLIFDIDDASCLLGNNYVQPAIAVK